MRQTIRTLLVGGVLLSAAACGTATDTPTTANAPSGNVPPAVAATCEALGQAYGNSIPALAKALSAVAADPKAVADAQESLASFATAVADATKVSEDAQLRADGKQVADQMRAKSADTKFFAAIKSTKDIDQAMGPTLTGWLSPVARHCS